MLANGVQQMRLAETNAAVKEERVVRFAGRLRYGESGGVGEIIVITDDKGVEGVLRVEIQIGVM